MVVWCTPGGREPHAPVLQGHSYFMLEGQLELGMAQEEEEQTTSVYRSSHSTLPTLLGYRVDEHSCMELSIRQQAIKMVHFALSMTIISHVQCATLRHKKLY